MLLIDVEHKSQMMVMASREGIETVEEYEIWLMGYTAGYKARHELELKVKQDGKM